MIYRSGINCGYVRLPEVVTPRTGAAGEEGTARRRDRGTSEERQEGRKGRRLEKKNQPEFIVTIDGGGCAYSHTCTESGSMVYKFLRLPMKPRSLESAARIYRQIRRTQPLSLSRSFHFSLSHFSSLDTLSFSLSFFFLHATHPPET